MKRCPECRRDYYDDTLLYCLDDGVALVEGPSSGEAQTAIFPGPSSADARPTTSRRPVVRVLAVVIAVALIGGAGYWLLTRPTGSDVGPSIPQHDGFLRAKVLIANENREDMDAAIKLFEQVVAEDPQFAAGWAQLARAYNKKAFYFASDAERKQFNENAEVAVDRSLAIDPNLPEGHLARGLVLWTHAKRFPHELAVQSYKRAIALDPNLDEAHHQLALVYLHIGLFDKARAEVGKALEINPGNTLARFRYGVIDMYRGRYEDAAEFFKSTSTEQTPALQAFQLAMALFKLGRSKEASELIDRFLRENPIDEGGVGTSVKAMMLAHDGKVEDALAAIKRADEIGRGFGHYHHTAFNIASAYALMNMQDQAVDYLQLAADDGFPCYPLFEADDSFVNIRRNSRYVALLAKLKQQWERYNATL